MEFFILRNSIQRYAWGSSSAIPDLLGIENPGRTPIAELWMGAHPAAPSIAVGAGLQLTLAQLVDRDPVRYLGSDVVSQFGPSLPFLFKVLSAETALSIQAHPGGVQAEEGFAREEAMGIAIDDPVRNYKDRNHKPEILCALTSFQGLSGFRSLDRIRAEFEEPEFAIVAARRLREALNRTCADTEAKGHFLRALLTCPARRTGELLAAALALASRKLTERDERERDEKADGTGGGVLPDCYGWIQRLAVQFPGDVGILAPLYLDLFSLKPGQAVFLKPGTLHAYLHGTGVELMATSDNVLRGGLTRKNIDVAELLKIVDTGSGPATIMNADNREPLRSSSGTSVGYRVVYRTSSPEFELGHVVLDGDDAVYLERQAAPQIALCIGGRARFTAGNASNTISRGDAIFIPAHLDGYSLCGPGVLYVASMPDPRLTGAAE